MKKSPPLRLLATLALLPALAHAERTEPGLHAVFSAGLTGGGDTVVTTFYDNGDKAELHAGSLLQLGGGVLWQSGPAPLAVLATANYHIDGTTAENGKAQFTRIPYELIAYYTGVNRWRFGVGLRHVQSAKATVKIDGSETSVDFSDTNGRLIEIGYQLSPSAWINLRAVDEEYERKLARLPSGSIVLDSSDQRFDGSHIGVNLLLQF